MTFKDQTILSQKRKNKSPESAKIKNGGGGPDVFNTHRKE